MIREFGAAAVTVAIDVDVNKAMPSGYEQGFLQPDPLRTVISPSRITA